MADSFPAAISEIAAAVERLLTETGPMSEDRLLAALHSTGAELGRDPEDTLRDVLDDDLHLVMPLTDGRWASLPALLAGRVFTHRLDAREIEHDLLDINPDLAPISTLTEIEMYQQLTDGSPLIDVMAPFDADVLDERAIPLDAVGEHGALLLARGRLRDRGLDPGDLVGLRLTTAGLQLDVIDEHALASDPPTDLGPRLRAILAAEPDAPEQLDSVVWTACADDPALFREPLPPVGQSLAAAGVAHDGDWLAAEGFDFTRWRVESRIGLIAGRYDLSDDEAVAVLATVTLYDRIAGVHAAAIAAEQGGDPDALADVYAQLPVAASGGEAPGTSNAESGREQGERSLVRATLEFLAEPAVADAVLAETLAQDGSSAAALGLFAETLEQLAPRAARPALRWLRAKAYEQLGDVEQAEATYRAAETLEPTWPLTLLDLARYASDRGDTARGLSLLRRAGATPDEPMVELLESFEAKPRPGLGRNQPCWCGSGRKYKQCHLHREQLPLAERAAWLYQKAGMFLFDGHWPDALWEVAGRRARFSESPDALIDAIRDPLVTDSVLFEGGAFEDFVATRGVLLPDDERLLAQQWLLVERSVYEVEAVRRGLGISVRDVRTGDALDVRERTGSTQLEVGQLICARVVPAGDTMQIFGGVEPVALHERDELIALLDSRPDPTDLVASLTRRFAPPVLHNTEGDPLVLCEATLRVPDPLAMARALDESYERDDAEAEAAATQWTEFVTTQGMQRIRAALRLRGDELHVDANSVARFDRVLATLRTLEPSITLVSESRQPAHDMGEVIKLVKRSPSGGEPPENVLDPSDPDIAAMLEEFAGAYEQNWLDESIPALAGRTPRECAADPTRRPDLIRLLDSFPAEDGLPGVMSPDRLRAALGLL